MQALAQLIFAVVPLVNIAQQTLADSSGKTPDRYIELPHNCDIVQLKAMESSGYLGVGSATIGNAGEAVSADHTYHSAATHFQVKYATIASGWMALSVPSHRAESSDKGRKRAYLSFDWTGRPQMRELNYLPENISFVLSGWPVIRDSTRQVIFAGPYYRLHLVDKKNASHRIATVGSDRAGRVTLYPAEDATRDQGESFANPPTLFMLSVLRSPGTNKCRSHRRTAAALNAESSAVDNQDTRRRRALEVVGGSSEPEVVGGSSEPLSIFASRLFPGARRLH